MTMAVLQAAWYPERPSIEESKLMSNFMVALAKFYPCTWCAADFEQNMQSNPPR